MPQDLTSQDILINKLSKYVDDKNKNKALNIIDKIEDINIDNLKNVFWNIYLNNWDELFIKLLEKARSVDKVSEAFLALIFSSTDTLNRSEEGNQELRHAILSFAKKHNFVEFYAHSLLSMAFSEKTVDEAMSNIIELTREVPTNAIGGVRSLIRQSIGSDKLRIYLTLEKETMLLDLLTNEIINREVADIKSSKPNKNKKSVI